MGSGASKTATGVMANPRVLYSNELTKKEKTPYRIDAPVLVDMQHGSVRYRGGEAQERWPEREREVPHEGGDNLYNKKHYFYHARLDHLGRDADKSKEDSFKFYYVTQGPTRAQGKKLFYVFGQGWDAKDKERVKPTETAEKGKDFAWPRKQGPNDLMYHVQITGSTPMEEGGDWVENEMLADLESTPDRSLIKLKVKSEDPVSSVKARMAVKLLKAAANISICNKATLLRNEEVLGDLRTQEERSPAILDISLTLV